MGKTKPLHECVATQFKAANYSNADIARKTGWSEQRVRRLLTGRTDLSAADMRTLARLIRKPIGALYGETEAATP